MTQQLALECSPWNSFREGLLLERRLRLRFWSINLRGAYYSEFTVDPSHYGISQDGRSGAKGDLFFVIFPSQTPVAYLQWLPWRERESPDMKIHLERARTRTSFVSENSRDKNIDDGLRIQYNNFRLTFNNIQKLQARIGYLQPIWEDITR